VIARKSRSCRCDPMPLPSSSAKADDPVTAEISLLRLARSATQGLLDARLRGHDSSTTGLAR
jgi:hypothetical protein